MEINQIGAGQQPQMPPQKPNCLDKAHIIAYIFIVLGLAAVIYGIIQYSKIDKSIQPVDIDCRTDSSLGVPCPATGSSSTENWQTYRNEEYGFEFKYPSYLSYKEDFGSDHRGGVIFSTEQMVPNSGNLFFQINGFGRGGGSIV